MKRTHLIAVLAAAVAVGVFAADASAYYHPGMGRFLSRDPGPGGTMGAPRVGTAGPAVGGGFLPRDPTEQYGDGMNLYQYVGGNPISSLDPEGLYEIDVHYYLTYWFAAKIPCFTDAEAKQIANADQGTDENPDTAPGFGGSEEQRERNRRYHGLDDTPPNEWQRNDLGELWAAAAIETRYVFSLETGRMEPQQIRHCDLDALGIYLHRLQDAFSHGEYRDSVFGHASALHWPDKTASDVKKSTRMAVRTWWQLKKWVQVCRCECYQEKVAGQILFREGKELMEFLRASGGPAHRSINDEELQKKRDILRVGAR